MVKFVGGFSPSTNAYKSYKNHTIAREGQWRMPRAYGSVKKEVKINIREYNYGGNYANYGGFQLPSWLQWAQFGMNWINQLIPQREYTPATVQPQDNNPFAKELEDLKKEMEELKAENEKLKNKPAETVPEVEEPEKEKPKDSSEISFQTETTGAEEAKEGKLLTTEAKTNIIKKRSDGKVNYQGWTTLANAYGIPNTESFRNWFRKEHLQGKNIWEVGTQNFPTEITYPAGSNNKYTFNGDKFATPLDINDPKKKGNVSTANMAAKRGEGTPAKEGTTTHSGTVSATIGGKSYSATSRGKASQDEVRKDLKTKLINNGVSADEAEKAIKNAKIKEN